MQISYHSALQKFKNYKTKKKNIEVFSVPVGMPSTDRYCLKLASTAGI